MALLQFFPTFMLRFIRKSVPKGLICLSFEDSKPKSWLIFQKCHYSSDIWPRLELNRYHKLFYASVKNWTEAKRFVRVQKSRITFFLLLPRVCVLSQPPTSTATVALRPLATTWRLAHLCSGLAKCDLGLAKWASLCCVADAWMEICHWWWRDV